MADKIRFTKRKIDEMAAPPAGLRVYVFDDGNDGLAVCVLPTGKKVFYCVRRVGRRVTRYRIGPCDVVPLERARKEAKRIAGEIACGRNPQAEKVERRNSWTVREALEHYLDRTQWSYERPRRNKPLSARTIKNYRWLLATHMAVIAARQLQEITTDDVLLLRDRIRNGTAPAVANQVLALLRSLIQHAIREGNFQGANPVDRVGRYPDVERERYLSREEIQRLRTALESEDQWFRTIINMLLLTGQRRGSVMRAKWEQIDLVNGEWRIPITKNQEPHCVPLMPELVKLLAEWRPYSGREWVFPSRVGDKGKNGGHVHDFTTKWRKFCAGIGLDGVRVHDLRHSAASMLARNGASLVTIGRMLAHQSPSSTRRYAHLDTSDVRAAMERAMAAELALSTEGAK